MIGAEYPKAAISNGGASFSILALHEETQNFMEFNSFAPKVLRDDLKTLQNLVAIRRVEFADGLRQLVRLAQSPFCLRVQGD